MSESEKQRDIAWLPAAVCALAGAATFQFFGNANHGYIDTWSLFYWWGFQWFNAESETQHGLLVLGLSGWLFWRNLKKAESLELRAESPSQEALDSRLSAMDSSWAASAAMLSGLLLHLLGFTAQQSRISIIGLLVFFWGVLRLAGGRRWGAAAWFPLAFLVFAIPFNALDSIGFWLRVWVVKASAGVAHLAGIGVLQSGTQLVAPDGRYNYDVAAACSGIRSLTALAALSLLAGYLNFRTTSRRAVTFLLCLPLVYLGNVARIVAIIFAAQIGGSTWGDLAHTVMGYGVFVIVLGGVLGAVAAMQRWWPEAVPPGGEERGEESRIGESFVPVPRVPSVTRVPFVPIVICTVALAEMFFLNHLVHSPPRGQTGVLVSADGLNPVELPGFIGMEWIGQRTEVTAVERQVLPADTGFSRKNYVTLAPPRREVFLSLVLSGRDRTSIHRPELCLVGQGWTIVGSTAHRFTFPQQPVASFPATLLRVNREVATPRGKIIVPQIVAYWFVGGDAVVATHGQRFLHDAWNRVVHARADRWAYVLMQTDASDGEIAALARMQTILDATLPAFQRPIAPSK